MLVTHLANKKLTHVRHGLQACKLGLFLSLSLVMIFSTLTPVVFAGNPLPPDEIKARNEWPHYVPEECAPPDEEAAVSATGSTNVSKVYLLGDSVMVGAYFDPANDTPLKKAIQDKGWTAQVDASGARGMSYAGSDPKGSLPGKNKSGLDAIKADTDAIKNSDTVVIELGTNETNPGAGASASSALFKGEMEQAINEVRNINSTANIYWVNLSSKPSQPFAPWVKQYNDVIRSVAAEKNINVVDTTNSGITLADGTHPNKAGYEKLSKVIVDTLDTPDAATEGAAAADPTSLQPGSGAPDGATFPNLDPTAMAGAIDKWMVQENPRTKMKGLGSTIVADAQHSNISPFLIAGIARMESNMADPADYNVSHGNNAFGRTATLGQPHFQGAMTWYKWSSVKASVDYTAPENKTVSGGGDIAAYIRNVYPNLLNGNLLGFFEKYSDNSSLYAANVQSWIDELVKLTGKKISPSDPSVAAADICCPTDSSGGNGLEGFTPGSGSKLKGEAREKYIFDWFISQGHLEPYQAAAIMGNMNSESGFDPTVFEGGTHDGDYPKDGVGFGLVQWTFSDRQDPLVARAKKAGVKPTDLDLQLNYVMWELNGKFKEAGDKLKSSGNVGDATLIVETEYEIHAGGIQPERTAAARAYLTKYGKGAPSATPSSATPSGDGNSADECCPPTSAPTGGDVQDGSPSDWKKMYTGNNKAKSAAMAHGKIDPKILVIHYTVGPTGGQDLLDYFAGNGLGIQFNVDKDGQVYQYFPLTNMQETYHVGDANSKAIGIEITGKDVNEVINNQKQFDAVASLSKFLCGYYKIPCSDPKGDMTGDSLSTAQGMLGHDETPTNDHNDPDAKFGQTIDRTDSSKHPYMMKLRSTLGFDPTPGKKGGAAADAKPASPTTQPTTVAGSTVGCSDPAADNVNGNGTKENPVGEGVNKSLALEAVRYDTKTNDGKYYYLWGGLHGPVSQLQDFAKDGGGTDCSGFVRYIIWRVYGKDIGSFVTSGLPQMSDFKEVSPSDVQAGDIGWRSDHVDFITDNQGGGKLHEFGAHSEANDLYGDSASASDYTKYFRYVGPKNGERS